MFASCSNTIRVNSWPSELLKENSEFIPPSDTEISHISWCNDNSYMAILQQGERPQILSTRDLSNIRTVHTINDHQVSSVAFKKGTKKHLAMGTKNGEVMIYDTKLRTVSRKFAKLVSPIEILEFSHDDLQLAALCEDAAVVFCTEADGKVNNEYKHSAKGSCVKFHPSTSNKMAVGCFNGYVTIWDTKTYSKMYNCQLHSQPVTGISLSRNGNFLISTGKDHKVCVTDLNSGESKFRINLNVPVNCVDLSFDDKIFVVGLEDGSVYVYDMNFAEQPLECLRQHNTPVNDVSFANSFKDAVEDESTISTVTTVQDRISEMRMTSPKTAFTDNSADSLKNLRREVMQSMKNQAEDLESQLQEHCKKFQAFINNEFKMINDLMKDKWELFGTGDVNRLFQGTESDYCDVGKH
ncbi:guanine nucleotide-binding protein subunit beta-like protein [Coccinella septempunctata]|uniref:guanine nucleotide-binding protein subunit beta-like protein n=1 Tax=Coccinella septempunctata TaxID=41139 RepID=UPI001D0818B2|nr:guanine nucleotide-binding protein subunit beta-like protein [Coccinella septempunctata]